MLGTDFHYHIITLKKSRNPFKPDEVLRNDLFEGDWAYDHAVADHAKNQIKDPVDLDREYLLIACETGLTPKIGKYCLLRNHSTAYWTLPNGKANRP